MAIKRSVNQFYALMQMRDRDNESDPDFFQVRTCDLRGMWQCIMGEINSALDKYYNSDGTKKTEKSYSSISILSVCYGVGNKLYYFTAFGLGVIDWKDKEDIAMLIRMYIMAMDEAHIKKFLRALAREERETLLAVCNPESQTYREIKETSITYLMLWERAAEDCKPYLIEYSDGNDSVIDFLADWRK